MVTVEEQQEEGGRGPAKCVLGGKGEQYRAATAEAPGLGGPPLANGAPGLGGGSSLGEPRP